MNDRTDEQMLGEKETGDIRKFMFLLWVTWGALIGMMVAMAAVGHVVRAKRLESGKVVDEIVVTVVSIGFIISGVISLVLALFLRGFLIRSKSWVAQVIAGGSDKSTCLLRYVRIVSMTTGMVAFVGICGFVPFILGAGAEMLYGFMIVGIAGLIWLRPRRSELVSMCRDQKTDDG